MAKHQFHKICKGCQKEFITENNHKVFCNDKCKRKTQKQREKQKQYARPKSFLHGEIWLMVPCGKDDVECEDGFKWILEIRD